MSRRLIYMAHPVAPTAEEAMEAASTIPRNATPEEREMAIGRPIRANLDSALRWLSWLRRSFPETTFIAPWIAGVQSVGSDGTPEEREAGMVDCCAAVERCDGIVLVGGRISSGMRREMEHGIAVAGLWADGSLGFEVYDLTKYIIEGASGRNYDHRTFEQWMRGYRESCTR